MKIRPKLLILLLAVALVPLVIGTTWQQMSMRRLGDRLAANTRGALIDIAFRNLHLLVDDYARLVNRDKKMVELAVRLQVREVERRLAQPPPSGHWPFFSRDYDRGDRLPSGMAASKIHFRTAKNGERKPIAVTYDEQVYFVVKGVAGKVVEDHMARLSTMPGVYRFLMEGRPDVMYWQYTSLEIGFHTSYPGHGGYPEEYDPRKRAWYKAARDGGKLGWIVMPEVSSGTVALTAAAPVYRPDGSFAGVTAVDVPFGSLFKGMRLPPQWEAGSEKMLVRCVEGTGGKPLQVMTLVHSRYQEQGLRWQQPVKHELLSSKDANEFRLLLADLAAGRSGVRKMSYKGKQSLWAYGPHKQDWALPLIIVPYDQIAATANDAEQQVLSATLNGLQIAGAGVLLVAALAVLLALRGSHSVTRPVRQLAHAAERFAEGDYGVHVDIATGDELQELGETVNDLGPKLLEREQMKQSLALAMEIQRHLLPDRPPEVANFDVAGDSIYCDETGGDYYDFIDLVDLGEGKLAIAVGDVTGHGVGAALLMASARAVLRSHATLHGDDLSDLFRTLNVHLVRDTDDERFMTLFYCVLDALRRSVYWVSGGHNPGVLWRKATGEIEELGSTGMPLGIMEDAEFGQAGPVELESGDVFLIGTDGIWEAHNAAREMFGQDRFLAVLAANVDGTSQAIYDAVVDAVADFRGGTPQEDDKTLVVIKVR